MKISIYRDGEHLHNTTIVDYSELPPILFTLSQHYGSGTYLAKNDVGENLFLLKTEWLEEEE